MSKPNDEAISAFLARQSLLDFNYPDIGGTAGDLPAGYDHNEAVIELGRGDRVFADAVSRMHAWRQFQVGWVEALPRETPIAVGENIAIRAKFFGLWTLAACRIIDVADARESQPRQFGFSFGTLPEHPEQGEECFEVNQSTDGIVTYRVNAFFRPNGATAVFAWPYLRYRFNQFREQSAIAMKRAMECSDGVQKLP